MHERGTLEHFPSNERLVSAGRVLYLTKDPNLIIRQLGGERLSNVPVEELLDNVSTDAIIPNKACLAWDGKTRGHLGRNLLTGFRGVIKEGEIAGNFDTVVAGESFARGSSRIHAPLAFQDAGINLIIANGERIFSENCVNLRIHLINPNSNQARDLLAGKPVKDDELLLHLSKQASQIMSSGSLFSYLKSIENGQAVVPEIETKIRPMTIAEKIIARSSLNQEGKIGLTAVKPGDEVVAVPNISYGYELQSNAVISAMQQEFKDSLIPPHPEKIFLYNDHTALMKDENTANLRRGQEEFAKPLGVTVYRINEEKGAPAICHTDMVENHALPGQLVLGNDSHTCSVGVLNNLAVGKGALDLAGAIAYDKMVLTVPESIKINLHGQFKSRWISTKDLILKIISGENFRQGLASGRVLEFAGDALKNLSVAQQYKLTNMSIEGQAFTGVTVPNGPLLEFMMKRRGLNKDQIAETFVYPDKNAGYAQVLDFDLKDIDHIVSEPGDTQNGRPLSEIIPLHKKIQKAYIGSCTHGTPEDLQEAAEILRGRKVAKGVKLYVQASSRANLEEARRLGIINDIVDSGAIFLPIGCGACMNAGPGSTEEGETGIFSTNRNFHGRTGKGETYLSSVYVTAASAVAGYICGPEDLEPVEIAA